MFTRIISLLKGFFGSLLSGLERKGPEALLAVEQEKLRKQIAKYNQGLSTHAGFCEKLISQVRAQEAQQREMRVKTAANLKAGNRTLAANYALQLQTVENELAENRLRLDQAEKTYEELLIARDVSVSTARAKLDALASGITDLKMQKAMAELTEMASGMVGTMGSAGETLDRLHNVVEEERQKAAGRARVARDTLNSGGVKMKESEQAAMAELALADFAAKEGMPLAPDRAKETPPKVQPDHSMGPESGLTKAD